VGAYDTSKPGDEFVCSGRHDAIITQAVFDQVQARIAAARKHGVSARIPGPLPLAAGLLTCAGCGGPVTMARRQDGKHADQYVCSHRHTGAVPCESTGYLASLAHDALLAQIGRLQGHPWQPQALDRVLTADPTADERARLQAGLRDARADQTRHVRRYAAATEDLSPEEVIVFRELGQEIQGRIDALETALDALPTVALTARDLQTVHHELAHIMLGEVVQELAATGDAVALRALVLKLVESAKVVDRVPDVRSRWLRVEVTWTREVQLLIDAGLLTLAPDAGRPAYESDPVARRRARQLDYYHRTKARAR
jgi:hypothetical protein